MPNTDLYTFKPADVNMFLTLFRIQTSGPAEAMALLCVIFWALNREGMKEDVTLDQALKAFCSAVHDLDQRQQEAKH